jgi:ethanolamine transporter EutH
MAYNASYLPAVITGKLVAGVLSLVVGFVLYKKFDNDNEKEENGEITG